MATQRHRRASQRRKRRVAGSLERSLAALTIGTVKAREERGAMLAPVSGGNMLQFRQVPVAGKVGKTPVAAEVAVEWDYPIVQANAQTDSDSERPHFTTGIELLSSGPVMIVPQLIAWLDSDDGWTVGATLRVTAWVPSAKKKHDFNAILHLTFAGYAVPGEDDTTSEPEE